MEEERIDITNQSKVMLEEVRIDITNHDDYDSSPIINTRRSHRRNYGLSIARGPAPARRHRHRDHLLPVSVQIVYPQQAPPRSSIINQLYRIYLIFMIKRLVPTIGQVYDRASATTVLMGASLVMLFINMALWVFYRSGKLKDSRFKVVLYMIFILTGILSPGLSFLNLS